MLGRTLHSNFNSVGQTVQRFRQKFDALLLEFDRGAIVSTFTLLTQSDSTIHDILDKLQDAEARENKKGDQDIPFPMRMLNPDYGMICSFQSS